ncbi:D-hydantoinase [Roseovarius sp. A-2]|uniref:hypothetical protein n=1 Tax=Roseovarius sp. A-2 TaxID=1570360 RepID=UPI0009B52977|nr:hypothetical protein [Roseovarius sp. A-2]GAW34806.1 D-hydantoinase [Roseovarius sp. A-2]
MGFIRKATITVGCDADIAIWTPEANRTIRRADLQDRADDTPYENLEVQGWSETVLLRGKTVVAKGKMVRDGQGAVILRRGRT